MLSLTVFELPGLFDYHGEIKTIRMGIQKLPVAFLRSAKVELFHLVTTKYRNVKVPLDFPIVRNDVGTDAICGFDGYGVRNVVC